jgi:hypothetical protein
MRILNILFGSFFWKFQRANIFLYSLPPFVPLLVVSQKLIYDHEWLRV